MASVLRQPVLALTSKFLQISPKTVVVPVFKALTAPQIAARGLSQTLTLNRHLWCATSTSSIFNKTTHANKQGKLCSCCSLHTEGDEKLATFLEKEIKDEQRTVQTATTVEGWDVKTDGTGVILTKKFNDEIIKVEFDVNDSVDSEQPIYEEEQAEVPELVSKPQFEVEIEKKSGRKLRFFCQFSSPEPQFADDQGTAPQENIEDQFSIVEVRLGDDVKSGDVDKFYAHSADVMDGTLYDLLMDMLDERGVDDDFINNMVAFATAYEYKLYLKFLEDLKSVISEK
ncbi:complement component 1 Q subcomponent-binding protein, mitochondrial-like [Mercenaria mercenaria]|uniref:complement component 1 Q subcomponent-binding protein, mitochondrial-like n=1 Tax=Mercenaria mercenaria TaxID=6596 RepID=UPI00234EE166|nr:complement component 1 Q subcomponent-binding protein, mitochondrial-like [Mercenaria mercenaria]